MKALIQYFIEHFFISNRLSLIVTRNPRFAENTPTNTHAIQSNLSSHKEKPYQNHIEQSSIEKRGR
jgi:hypothetical protein